jgi:hypothetical protein
VACVWFSLGIMGFLFNSLILYDHKAILIFPMILNHFIVVV